ncbi:MAG: DUF3417 domain-containing protein, partial [Nitrospiraceae bacterium]
PEVGWALGDGQEHDDDSAWDAVEAETLYNLLEQEVIPKFYARDGQGIPRAWVTRIRESMALLTAVFSTNRTVRQYTERHYLPAAAAYHMRAADKGVGGSRVVSWEQALTQQWATLHFGDVTVRTREAQHIFEVEVYLNDLDPKAILVELYADGVMGGAPLRQEMARVRLLAGLSGGYLYSAAVPAARSPADYTARVIPYCAGVAVPLEVNLILWQR